MAFLSACKNSIVAVTCFGVLILLERPIAYGQTTANKIDQLTQQWLSTERQTANLKATWLTEKPLLTQRIELLRQEKNQINTLLKENKNSTSEAEEKRELLQQQQAKLEREQVLTINAINQLKAQLDSLLSRLPPPLQSTWQNEPSENNAVLLEQQLTRLSKLKAFNDRITIHTMRLTNNTDEEILVKQLYLGVSQAWFSSANGQFAGYGLVEHGKWQWHFDKNIDSTAILNAIAIVENQKPAEKVTFEIKQLPVGVVK